MILLASLSSSGLLGDLLFEGVYHINIKNYNQINIIFTYKLIFM